MNFSGGDLSTLLPMRPEGHNVTLSDHNDMRDKLHDSFEFSNQ